MAILETAFYLKISPTLIHLCDLYCTPLLIVMTSSMYKSVTAISFRLFANYKNYSHETTAYILVTKPANLVV